MTNSIYRNKELVHVSFCMSLPQDQRCKICQ